MSLIQFLSTIYACIALIGVVVLYFITRMDGGGVTVKDALGIVIVSALWIVVVFILLLASWVSLWDLVGAGWNILVSAWRWFDRKILSYYLINPSTDTSVEEYDSPLSQH